MPSLSNASRILLQRWDAVVEGTEVRRFGVGVSVSVLSMTQYVGMRSPHMKRQIRSCSEKEKS